ncbi:unnamed protein product [Cochlearia groenlandica]
MFDNEIIKEYFLEITKTIGERLSPLKLDEYINLMKRFRSGDVEEEVLISSVQKLFEEEEYLSQIFNNLMLEDETTEPKIEEQVITTNKEVGSSKYDDETEEDDIREKHRQACCMIGRGKADLPYKKRVQHRLEWTTLALESHEFKSEINQNRI